MFYLSDNNDLSEIEGFNFYDKYVEDLFNVRVLIR